MNRTVVLNVVGLTPQLIGEHTPRLSAFKNEHASATINSAFPAVTCTAQSDYLTGTRPDQHGIVGNGWYFKDLCEIKFWRQPNGLVQQPKVWDAAREKNPDFTCAKLFWWYNMYSSADFSVTPRPMYPSDGRKIPDIYTHPGELRWDLQKELGQFPLFNFWGPNSNIISSKWIAGCARRIEQKYQPTLSLVYIPHLDYALQAVGPYPDKISQRLQEVDTLCGELIDFYEQQGVQVMIHSEYGITPVDKPVDINRVLRKAGYIEVREELRHELLDPGASTAFALADHQVAHVYVQKAGEIETVRRLLEQTDGVEHVLDRNGKKEFYLNHERSGELVAVAERGAFFTYYYWLDDRRAPDFARSVDIHRKPGYDPAELFIDPEIKFPKLRIAKTLTKKKLGFRYTMQVVPLHADLVKGSHGRVEETPEEGPLVMSSADNRIDRSTYRSTDIHQLILDHVF